jgi:hypothetical protein
MSAGTSLEDLIALSDTDTGSTISREHVPKPSVTVEEVDQTGSKTCPWAQQRLYKTVPTASFHEQFGEVTTWEGKTVTFGDCMRLLSAIDQFESHLTREQLVAKYGEDNIIAVEKMRAESENCLQRMTNEIVEEPEAVNATSDEDLHVNCNEDYPMMEHPPSMEAHFDQLFAALASDPETAAKINRNRNDITTFECM